MTRQDKSVGFEAFWDLFPRDPRRNRKYGKRKCLEIWMRHKLADHGGQIMAALREDIEDIARGVYKDTRNPSDKMLTFPGIQPWLNQGRWDRELRPVKAKEARPAPPLVEPTPIMTPEEKASMLDAWKAIAKGRAKPWPRRTSQERSCMSATTDTG